MPVQTGLDRLARGGFSELKGKRIALLCNQASITAEGRHVLDLMLPHHHEGDFTLQAVFGPQHGIWGHTQDNMIEWEGYQDPRTGLTFHSLYGATREPHESALQQVDLFVVDVPDVGARYYTFIWSMALCMKACARLAIPLLVLDRPNPIGGVAVEGPGLDPEYASFVGLYPMPIRHGLTVAEIARHLRHQHFPTAELEVLEMAGWERSMRFPSTGLLWAMPSPNMPTPDTALVYPGMCLLEGTTLSEGRGTTRPFEIFGAPWIDGWRLAEQLESQQLPGVFFRPIQFQPTFQKHAGTLCGGCFLHVTDAEAFQPVLTALTLLKTLHPLHPEGKLWRDPPYEYEHEKLPIEILLGSRACREWLEAGPTVSEMRDRLRADAEAFAPDRSQALLYI